MQSEDDQKILMMFMDQEIFLQWQLQFLMPRVPERLVEQIIVPAIPVVCQQKLARSISAKKRKAKMITVKKAKDAKREDDLLKGMDDSKIERDS